MKRTDPAFHEAAQRIATGESTCAEVAEALGLKMNTLYVWLKRNKVTIPDKVESKFVVGKPRYGAALEFAPMDEEKAANLNKALEKVLAHEMSSLAAATLFGVNYRTLARKAEQIRKATGEPAKRVRALSTKPRKRKHIPEDGLR